MSRNKKLLWSFLVAAIWSVLPWCANEMLGMSWDWLYAIVLVPGMIVAVAVSGNIHAFNIVVAMAANTAFYAAIFYLILSLATRGKKLASEV